MRRRSILTLATVSALAALGVCVALPRGSAQEDDETPAASGWRQRAASEEILCNEQTPLPYLIRDSWSTRVYMDRDEQRDRRGVHQKAIRFRTENYGFFTGFGLPEWNAHTPAENSVNLRLFDRPIRLNQRIIAAARCAEQEIARTCTDTYEPRRLSGLRDRNTYHNGEVSNHVYGIAIDLDPQQNTCCNCVKEWRLHPLCQATPASIFDRMVMPECWVQGFEKYGFYWLGHDRLMDTMHFEFLGDPEHVLISDGPPPHMSQ
ncbi:MAG: M15 family metallopeptidase [Myxococcales bacterium]|nr:M15 family metallopeptidase [Myxococcales bacterium]